MEEDFLLRKQNLVTESVIRQQVSYLHNASSCSAALCCLPARLPRHLVKFRPELTRQPCLYAREIVMYMQSVRISKYNNSLYVGGRNFNTFHLLKDDELDSEQAAFVHLIPLFRCFLLCKRRVTRRSLRNSFQANFNWHRETQLFVPFVWHWLTAALTLHCSLNDWSDVTMIQTGTTLL